jgi:hypothetical protein
MDRDTVLLLVALFLMLIGYPLTAVGTDGDATPVWIAGLVAVAAGALIPPVTRFVGAGDGDNDNGNDDGNDDR